ncbi:MAG: selenide, water dikinase SelD [Chitinophagaceae bacterium]|jgi:selenide,water dikinase|nr:selenide, water dikinase SelD [Chitinophagaceae bacterium]
METPAPIRLTAFAHGAGCGCKIAPAVLDQIIKTAQPAAAFPQLLVGNSSKDDAAVYDLGNGTCVVSTTDFFMPIVDDAFDFGRIAGANAISDVYAMGGRPLMAVAVLGWPVEKLPPELAAQVLEGCRAVCAEAQIPLAGGHSIDSPEPFFGLAVTGTVQKEHLKQNNTAQNGDLLFLTKPLGVGILSTTMKRGELPADYYAEMIRWMTQLNSLGEQLGTLPGVHAMTDVTGFGLLGHLLEMCEGSGLGATLTYASIPVAAGVRECLQQNMVPDATYRNWNAYSTQVKFAPGVNVMEAFKLLPDPQTNGGLLLAVAPEAEGAVRSILQAAGLGDLQQPIGHLHLPEEKRILIV